MFEVTERADVCLAPPDEVFSTPLISEIALPTQIHCNVFVFFFFSSRRRHTRLQGDWSSDVCSSDLLAGARSFGTPPPNGTQEGIDILYSGGHYWRYLTLARAGVLPFLALLLLATWLWARRLFASQGAALLSVLLLASVPAVLGHAALASLHVAAAAPRPLAPYAPPLWLGCRAARDARRFWLPAGPSGRTAFS